MKKILGKLDKLLFFNFLTKIYLKFLIYQTRKYIKNYSYLRIFKINSQNNEFSELCEKYLTDKGGLKENLDSRNFHFYSQFYYEYFQKKKRNIKLIFECGIGTPNKNIKSNTARKGKPGASLRVLREYFKNAHIYAADIDKNILFEDERISTFYVNQLDNQSINEMWRKINKNNFDLIIDDGLHTLNSAYAFFNQSFSKLRPEGLYVIEDVHVAYLRDLVKKLEDFKPKILTSDKANNIDDYLIIIEKD